MTSTSSSLIAAAARCTIVTPTNAAHAVSVCLPYALYVTVYGRMVSRARRALQERLEVRLQSTTMEIFRREATERGSSVAEIVREAIGLFLNEDRPVRLRAAETLFRAEASVADWSAMKRQIERAHLT